MFVIGCDVIPHVTAFLFLFRYYLPPLAIP